MVSVILAREPAGAKSWSAPSIVTIRLGTRACERHSRRPMIAVRETERGDARIRERLARCDDVRLVWVAAEAVQDRRAADGRCVREMEDAVELGVLDANPDPLEAHSSGVVAAFTGTSGTARSSKTFLRSSM